MSAYFMEKNDDETPEKEQADLEGETAANDEEGEDDPAEPYPDMPLLRTQTPVWADVQRTLSTLRLRGVSPRQTLESYRKSRNSWNDGRISGRLTGRITRDLFDMERTSTFFTKEGCDDRGGTIERRSFRDELDSAGPLREIAENDVRRSREKTEEKTNSIANSLDDSPSKGRHIPWQQDVLTELKIETGVAETDCRKGSRNARRRSQSTSSHGTQSTLDETACPSGNATTAVRSLRVARNIEAAENADLFSDNEDVRKPSKPQPGIMEGKFCRIRSLREKKALTKDMSQVVPPSEPSEEVRSPPAKEEVPLTPVAPSTPLDGRKKRGFRPARVFATSSSTEEDETPKKKSEEGSCIEDTNDETK
jgi:hypothetical protein